MSYIVLDVGCMECGESTEVINICDSKEEAINCAEEYGESIPNFSNDLTEFQKGLREDSTTYVVGDRYFIGGERSLEVHEYN